MTTKYCGKCKGKIDGVYLFFPECGHALCEECLDGPFVINKACPIDRVKYTHTILVTEENEEIVVLADDMIYEFYKLEILHYEKLAKPYDLNIVNNEIEKVAEFRKRLVPILRYCRDEMLQMRDSADRDIKLLLRRNLLNMSSVILEIEKSTKGVKNNIMGLLNIFEEIYSIHYPIVRSAVDIALRKLEVIHDRFDMLKDVLENMHYYWRKLKQDLDKGIFDPSIDNINAVEEDIALEDFNMKFELTKFITIGQIFDTLSTQ